MAQKELQVHHDRQVAGHSGSGQVHKSPGREDMAIARSSFADVIDVAYVNIKDTQLTRLGNCVRPRDPRGAARFHGIARHENTDRTSICKITLPRGRPRTVRQRRRDPWIVVIYDDNHAAVCFSHDVQHVCRSISIQG